MIRESLIALAAFAYAASAVAGAHPGHGSKVVMGTPREVSHDAIVVETRDVATATIVTVRILLHPGSGSTRSVCGRSMA